MACLMKLLFCRPYRAWLMILPSLSLLYSTWPPKLFSYSLICHRYHYVAWRPSLTDARTHARFSDSFMAVNDLHSKVHKVHAYVFVFCFCPRQNIGRLVQKLDASHFNGKYYGKCQTRTFLTFRNIPK